MSNFLAIATATETLKRLLLRAVAVVPGANVTTERPDRPGPAGPYVNLFLFQVTPNTALRNVDVPTRRPGGDLVQRPAVALDLHYLLSFHGNHVDLEPHRLLGGVARTLHARPVLTRQDILAVTEGPDAHPLLVNSDLAEAVELVKFSPTALSLEELSRLWSVFPQTPYTLSMTYQGSVVQIESADTPQTALPVRERLLYVLPFRQPVVEQVFSQAGVGQPLVVGSTLLLRGRQLRGEVTRVRVGVAEVTPPAVSDTEITLPLTSPPIPAGVLRAGAQGVQVIHLLLMGRPPAPHRGVESNVAAFVLRPTITSVNFAGGAVGLQIDPIVGKDQRVVLLLNERADTAPAAYAFPKSLDADTSSVQVAVSGVRPATYFVRVQVDGAESPLDLDPASTTFGPTVTIS